MILTVANHKGGVGKTTTALTLAHLLWLDDVPVSLLDLDAPSAEKPAGAAQALRRARALGIPAWDLDTLPADPRGHVVIDTPPDLADPAVASALETADCVLVPSGVSVEEIEVTAAAVLDIADPPSLRPRYTVVLTRVPHYAGRRADEAAALLRAELGGRALVATAQIPALAAVGDAAAAGTTVAEGRHPSWRRAARAYRRLAQELELI